MKYPKNGQQNPAQNVQTCKKSHDSSGDQQEKSKVFRVFNGVVREITNRKDSGKKWLIRRSIEKISSVQSSQLDVSAWRIHAEIAVSDSLL